MNINDIPWVTHTHTDCLDVCKIYEGEMPIYLGGESFWNNHYYLINSKYKRNNDYYSLSGNLFFYEEELSYPIRLINILSNIDSELIVLDHEDMILYKKANIEIINDSLSLLYEKELDSIGFIKNINAKYNNINKNQFIQIIDRKSDWIFSIQPSIWRKESLQNILKMNLSSNIWQIETRSQEIVKKLGIKIGVLSSAGIKRGMMHFDSEYYPYIATAIVKGKWNTSEYEKELTNNFKKYNINPLIRGCT